MSVTPSFKQLARHRDVAPFRKARRALGTAVAHHEYGFVIHRKIVTVDLREHLVAGFENKSPPAMLHQTRRSRSLLDHRAIRRQIAIQYRDAALRRQRALARSNYGVVQAGARRLMFSAMVLPLTVSQSPCEKILYPVHDRGNSARMKQIFHQILARRLDVNDAGGAPR